jgi:hypothetical protein
LKAAYKRVDPQVRALEEENERLKRIIAKQTIELEFKTELLKRRSPHIEKYMYWYNNVRRHGALKGITPAEKWAQGWACYPVRQSNTWAQQDVSRPSDFENWTTGQQLDTNLDKHAEPIYLSLAPEQEHDSLVVNSFNKNVQLLGG